MQYLIYILEQPFLGLALFFVISATLFLGGLYGADLVFNRALHKAMLSENPFPFPLSLCWTSPLPRRAKSNGTNTECFLGVPRGYRDYHER